MAQSSSPYGSTTYLEELFSQYQDDPTNVPDHWQKYFSSLSDDIDTTSVNARTAQANTTALSNDKQSRVSQLIHAFRNYGHKCAHINPLSSAPELDDDLKPAAFGLQGDDLSKTYASEGLLASSKGSLNDILAALKTTYCRTVGVQYYDLPNREERMWLQEYMEKGNNLPSLNAEEKQRLLKGLLVAERFEQYIHKKFIGAKRFSLEGGESLIPMLDTMIESAGGMNMSDIVIGMAHRGRLNVLANTLNKPLAQIFSEFTGNIDITNDSAMGDVKYHKGKSFDIKTSTGHDLHVSLLSNPSHLEAVNPVVEGSARARQHMKGDSDRSQVLPVLIHGDAAFIGQGVVPETLNLGTVDGFTTGGTIHVVINNQLGFTARPEEVFGTEYCTDFARMLQVPIFHVNGEDTEACAYVMKLAMAYRQKYKRDVVIDMVCFRKYGHNEGDDPTFTQPLMYEKIKAHKGVLNTYIEKLKSNNELTDEQLNSLENEFKKKLDDAYALATGDGYKAPADAFSGVWSEFDGNDDKEPKTAITDKTAKAVSQSMTNWPKGFEPHKKVKKLVENRSKALLEDTFDWGTAELAAYGSLLEEGWSIRLTGQDVKRGTFSHRHVVQWDINTDKQSMPLAEMAKDGASLEVYNSPLSEEAVLGYEYGYAHTDPKSLVIWEAQFGDFANGAQIIIDQFISSSEVKWNRMSGLVMLLPHGFEGQGPEHSSARLERYLQLCAGNSMTICNMTTPAQIFHVLRRHMLRKVRRPLIIMSPKSLLRHPKAVSKLDDLTNGEFMPVIPDAEVKKAKRVVLCSGKVYYDLLAEREKRVENGDKDVKNVAIVRVEQLSPLPVDAIKKVLKDYGDVEVIWVQEEPRNQGAWTFILDNLTHEIGKIRYIGRVAAASPAVGSPKQHEKEQNQIVDDALTL